MYGSIVIVTHYPPVTPGNKAGPCGAVLSSFLLGTVGGKIPAVQNVVEITTSVNDCMAAVQSG